MKGILKDTMREMIDRKTIHILGVVTIVAILFIVASSFIQTGGNINFDVQMDVDDINETLGNPIMRGYGLFITILIFLVVMASAGVFPNMFIKGRADFFLSKPLTRMQLFSLKFVSIWLTYGILVFVSAFVVYLVIYLTHGIFDTNVFYLLLMNMVSLFIWLAITSFGGIVLNSTGMAMMSAFLAWVIQRVLSFHEEINMLIDSQPINFIVTALYHVFPKTGEIDDLTMDLTLNHNISSWLPVYTSLVFIIVLLTLTVYLFKRKNY